MRICDSIRVYHVVLAILALLAYFSDELRHIHAWFGYAVSAVLIFRILWSFKGEPQLKLSCLIPTFKGIGAKNFFAHPSISKTITLGVYISLIGAAVTGIAMDKGRALGLSGSSPIQAEAFSAGGEHLRGEHQRAQHHQRSTIMEAHEIFANIFIIFVVLHILHMFAYRRPMAKYMIFLKR